MAIDYNALAIPKGPSRYQTKLAAQRAAEAHWREVTTAVAIRDGSSCRVCGKFCPPRGGLLTRGHAHHLQYRSQGGPDETWNLVTLCAGCHDEEHGGKLTLSGNADERDPVTGRLAGVKVERPGESGWEVVGWR